MAATGVAPRGRELGSLWIGFSAVWFNQKASPRAKSKGAIGPARASSSDIRDGNPGVGAFDVPYYWDRGCGRQHGRRVMPRERAATATEIRSIVGPADDAIISSILALGATRDDVVEAKTWLVSDDYLHRKLHHSLQGRAAEVFEILEAELAQPDEES
jgi:hypothetical protein